MSSMRPVAFYGLKVPPNGLRIEGNPGLPAAFQITMAAIDPTEAVTTSGDAPPRATLKIIRNIFDVVEEESDDDDESLDYDSDDIDAIRERLGLLHDALDESESDENSDDDEEEHLTNGGPSDPEKVRKAQEKALLKAIEEDEDAEMDDLPNGINGKLDKGKGRATDDDEVSDDGMSEYVVCTLDPNQHYQQTMNIVIGEDEECYFRVEGTHTVYLTGNFVTHPDNVGDESDCDSDHDDELDELDELDDELLYGGEGESDEDESEEDELDDLADPRVMEIDSEEEAPKLVEAKPAKKNKNKRAAEEEVATKAAEEEKKSNKKLKTNAGQAVAGAAEKKEEKKEDKKASAKEEKKGKKEEKKIQFAEKLEQGPTPSKNQKPGARVVNGVTIEDRKTGTGPAAKKGDKVGMRYIGKLKDGKVFDSNKKGKPFEFKVGSGEVIKGWDVGIVGMAVGGERRITVPAKLAYGSKALPGIPANSELTFDLKMIALN